ncbi:hypothetical protein K474DRAFT_911719 [Panus rudis PR-1116 ss-1]|nr:hypothetical protein K474DRAFT_911719 [Panus rudis PR-1116 ss-1]
MSSSISRHALRSLASTRPSQRSIVPARLAFANSRRHASQETSQQSQSTQQPQPTQQPLSPPQPRIRKLEEPEPDNPLPKWGLIVNKISSFVIIPTAIIYAVFFMDFGDHEHVFSAPRRWLDRQRAAFFSLSPAEQELVQASESPRQPEGEKN